MNLRFHNHQVSLLVFEVRESLYGIEHEIWESRSNMELMQLVEKLSNREICLNIEIHICVKFSINAILSSKFIEKGSVYTIWSPLLLLNTTVCTIWCFLSSSSILFKALTMWPSLTNAGMSAHSLKKH